MNLFKIKEISLEKHISLNSVAESIKMSPQNLHKCIRENKISANDLEKIADALGVSVCIFFDKDKGKELEVKLLDLYNEIFDAAVITIEKANKGEKISENAVKVLNTVKEFIDNCRNLNLSYSEIKKQMGENVYIFQLLGHQSALALLKSGKL